MAESASTLINQSWYNQDDEASYHERADFKRTGRVNDSTIPHMMFSCVLVSCRKKAMRSTEPEINSL